MRLKFLCVSMISLSYAHSLWAECTRWECEKDAVHAVQCLIDAPSLHPHCAERVRTQWQKLSSKDFQNSINLLSDLKTNSRSFSANSIHLYNASLTAWKEYFRTVNNLVVSQLRELAHTRDASHQLEFGFLSGMRVPEQLSILQKNIEQIIATRTDALGALKNFSHKKAVLYFIQHQVSYSLEEAHADVMKLIVAAESDNYFIGALKVEHRGKLVPLWRELKASIAQLESELSTKIKQEVLNSI